MMPYYDCDKFESEFLKVANGLIDRKRDLENTSIGLDNLEKDVKPVIQSDAPMTKHLSTHAAKTPTTQKEEKLSNDENKRFREYCQKHKCPLEKELKFGLFLADRKRANMQIFGNKADCEAEFENFLKTPPQSQVLELNPKKLPLNNDEILAFAKLIKDGKIQKECVRQIRAEFEKEKALRYQNYSAKVWDKDFAKHIKSFDEKGKISLDKKSQIHLISSQMQNSTNTLFCDENSSLRF